MYVDPSAAEAMAEDGVEPRVPADILHHVSTFEAESSLEGDTAEKVSKLSDAEIPDRVACLEQDTQRSKEEMIEDSGEAHKHARISIKETGTESNFVIEDLKLELRRLEEKQLLISSSNESRCSLCNVLQENAHEEVEDSKFCSGNLENEDERLNHVTELEILKVQMQVAHYSHARLESEKVALRQERDDEVSRLSSRIMSLEIQLREIEEEHSSVLESSLEIIDDKKSKLKDRVAFILEDRQKEDEELVGMLETCQEQIPTQEVEQQNLLFTIETSNAAPRQLEGYNVVMSSEFEQQKYFAEGTIVDLTSELQTSQYQQHELQLQLQGFCEENTDVVMKAIKLDQEVEELKSDKLRCNSDLERLVQERERREEELEVELRTCREHVQSLVVEKLASVTLVDSLITQLRELEEDKRQLTGLSNEASQSVQHLWEENNRLIEGYNRLEQEKQGHEGERMELVAGIQTVWEQLHAANEREALHASDLRGLNERRDAEEMVFDQKIKDLELKLEASEKEKFDLISKSEGISEVLDALRQETSRKLKDLQEEKDQLVDEASELVKQKKKTEQAVSIQQISWETRVQALESEKAVALSTVDDLGQQLHASREKVKDLTEKDEKSYQLILDLREEIVRLSSEIDKLEEVKERQEGERLELAADLQAAWDQIQAVRDSEATIATELSELKDLRNEEKLRSDELVQELRWQLHELEERTFEAGTKMEQLLKRLNELHKEQELQNENKRLGAEISILEQDKGTMLTEKTVLLAEVRTLQGRVEVLELDKNKMANEIEELNQWLQGPAAEKKQLAANLDEMTRLLKGLELERTQLTTSVSEMQEEKEKIQKDAGKLQDMINVLEEQNAKSLLVHEDSILQLESLEEEKRHALKTQADSAVLVQNLNEKIQLLEGELTRMISVHENSLLRIQSLKEEKTVLERLLEERSVDLDQLPLDNTERVAALGKFEGELQPRQTEVELLKTEVSSLEVESLSMKTLHKILHSQLQVLEVEKSQAENLVVALGEEKSQLLQSLEESELCIQGLMQRNSESSETISRLEADLMKRSEEIQVMNGRLTDVGEEKENFLSQLNELLQNMQAENLKHINRPVSLEDMMKRIQAEFQRHVKHIESLSTVHQGTLFQLQALAEDKVDLTKALGALTFSVHKFQAENLEHISKAAFSEREPERRQMEIQGIHETLLQLQTLEEEKAVLDKSLDASELSVHELEGKNVEHTDRVKILEGEVVLRREEMQRLEKKAERLSSGHQIQILEEEKTELIKSFDSSNLLVQKLQAEIIEYTSKAASFEEEVERKEVEVHELDETIENLSTIYQNSLLPLHTIEEVKSKLGKSLVESVQVLQVRTEEKSGSVNFLEEEVAQRQAEIQRLAETESRSSAHQDSLLQSEVSKEEKAELLRFLDTLNSSVLELHLKNEQHMNTIKILEDEVARSQAEVQGLEENTERLCTANQATPLQLQACAEQKYLWALDVSNLSVLKLRAENSENVTSINSSEEAIKRKQSDMQDIGKEMECLSTAHQNTLLRLQTLEEEKVKLVKYLDVFSSSFQELLEKNVQREKFLEEVAQMHMQRLEVESERLLTTHDDSLLQGLGPEKSAITSHLLECQDLIQKLHSENSELASAVRKFHEELYWRREKIESLNSPVHSLDDKDFREASEYHGVPFQVHLLEGAAEVARSGEGCNELVEQDFDGEMFMKMKSSKLLGQSELMVKELQLENVQLSTTVSKLEKHVHDESRIFTGQVQSLEVVRESFGQDCIAKIRCLEEENSQLAKALEESNLSLQDLQTVVDYLKASVIDLGRGKDELVNHFRLVQEQTCVIVAERDQLSSELQMVGEQLQEYVERLQESESVAIKSKEEALELAKQLENFRAQVPKQVGCTLIRNGELVTGLEPVLDRERMSFWQLEISHLIGANIDPREELQQASMGWVEIITTVCQELAKLLRSVGEEKEKLVPKQGLSHQKTEVLTNLCEELDRLILGVREKTERFAEELSLLKDKLVKSKNERFSLGSDADLNVSNYQLLPIMESPENREPMLDVETSCQTLQLTQVEKIELEAHVVNLSSYLSDSQGQLKALVIKSSIGNPYLLTSRADDGGHRKGLACFSADDNGVLNYGSELKVGKNIKALDQEKKEKKGNATLPSFTQRTQTPGRSFRKCKVNMQQPKRRWIF